MDLWAQPETNKIEDLKIRLGVNKHTNEPFDVPLEAFMKHTYYRWVIWERKNHRYNTNN